MKKSALITGIGGQDGHYLTELLISKGYFIFGIDSHVGRLSKLHSLLEGRNLAERVSLEIGDVRNRGLMSNIVESAKPSEIYNLAAQSNVELSFREPVVTIETTLAIRDLLELVVQIHPCARIFQASTAEMFGEQSSPQSERATFQPISPYGKAKLEAHEILKDFRQKYGLHASAGILFNHESPRRREEFVSRKITSGIAKILAGDEVELRLGNLTSRRDWGHARDYVEAMWLMLQQRDPGDLVIATGVSHSVKEFAEFAFALVGEDWHKYVVSDPSLFRPTDPPDLCGDASIARERLGWKPRTCFAQLVKEMIASDLRTRTTRPR